VSIAISARAKAPMIAEGAIRLNGPMPAPAELPQPSTTGPVRCPHFGPCGGCTSLDVPYLDEVRAKEEKLRAALSRHPALGTAPILSILGAAEPLYYRTAIKVPFGWSRGGPVAGFYERRSHRIVDLETCLIQHPRLTAVVLVAKELVSGLKIAIHDERTGRGILRALVARIGEGSGEILAGLVVQAQGYGKIRGLALKMMERLQALGLVGVVQNVHAEEGAAVLGETTLPLAGRAYLDEISDGLRFRTGISAFGQVNAGQAQVLYGEVLRLLGDVKDVHVADLYCGVGPISLRLARAGALVVGVEHDEEAVRSARYAAKQNDLAARARFVAGDAGQALTRLSAEDKVDVVVVDPPRRGLSPAVIDAIARCGAARLLYVACDPFTFARDLELLAPAFSITAIRPVDLFPRTLHLEVVALLQRK
jgi:23S rRNA (uracil1939-C5)-methyltransferase